MEDVEDFCDMLGFLEGQELTSDFRLVNHVGACVALSPIRLDMIRNKIFLPKKLLTGRSLGSEDMPIVLGVESSTVQAINPDTANDKRLRLQTHNLDKGTLILTF